jgi:hypothetical protein
MRGVRGLFLLGLAAGAAALLAAENKPVAAEAKPAAAEEPEDTTRARDHHYLFAHRALPQIFFGNVERLIADFKQDPARPLAAIWDMVGERLPEKARLEPKGLTGEYRTDEAGRTIIVVTLPAAERIPEAAFAALVVDGEKQWYLTYERTFAPDAFDPAAAKPPPVPGAVPKVYAVLCGWTKEGAHSNYGLTEEMTRAAFDRLLGEFLKKQAAPRPTADSPSGPAPK